MKRLLRLIGLGRSVAAPERLFIDVFHEYVDLYLKENEVAQGTERSYTTYRRNTLLYIADRQLQDLKLSEIRSRHAEDFRTWLRTNLPICSIRYASRHVELWKRVTKYAQRVEYTAMDPLSSVESHRDKAKKIVTLTEVEVRKIMNTEISKRSYAIAADLFLFQCFTGLSYCDIWRFELQQDGRIWVEGDRQKSQRGYTAPLFDEAKAIIVRYQGKLPRLSNQKYNEYLKEVAVICGIKKHVTSHMGRKTHATLLADRGMQGKPISMILGNTEAVANKDYINHTKRIITNEMDRLGIGTQLLAS